MGNRGKLSYTKTVTPDIRAPNPGTFGESFSFPPTSFCFLDFHYFRLYLHFFLLLSLTHTYTHFLSLPIALSHLLCSSFSCALVSHSRLSPLSLTFRLSRFVFLPLSLPLSLSLRRSFFSKICLAISTISNFICSPLSSVYPFVCLRYHSFSLILHLPLSFPRFSISHSLSHLSLSLYLSLSLSLSLSLYLYLFHCNLFPLLSFPDSKFHESNFCFS